MFTLHCLKITEIPQYVFLEFYRIKAKEKYITNTSCLSFDNLFRIPV